MATRSQRDIQAKSKAIRDIARQTRGYRERATARYAEDILNHPEKEPARDSLEGKQLGRLASNARWGKAPQEYQDAWADKYWYKGKKGAAQ